MRPHRGPQPSFGHVPPEVVDKVRHPFDKLVIALPPVMASWKRAYGPAMEWKSLPANPLMPSFRRQHEGGYAPVAAEAAVSSPLGPRGRDEENGGPQTRPAGGWLPARPFRCDPCDRSFAQEEEYNAHMKTHIYCTVPGCHFTCRAHRAHQMEEHMDALHNRHDAPNLVDTGAYLEQRKRRFPTQEAIKDKVEELYYKAARGVVLPDERRRWLRQYGIDVGKRARTEGSYIARGTLPEKSRSPSAQSNVSEVASAKSSHSSGPANDPPLLPPQERSTEDEVVRSRFIQPPAHLLEDPTAPPSASAAAPEQQQQKSLSPSSSSPAPSFSSSKQPAAPSRHPTKIIPLGPNGTLTPRQRVQLVRERYAAAKEVPQFYVCHRCGTKGEHWVDNCPTKGDATFNRHVLWGEAKRETEEGKPKAAEKRGQNDRSRQAEQENSDQVEPRLAEGQKEVNQEGVPSHESVVPIHSEPNEEALEVTPLVHRSDNGDETNTSSINRRNSGSEQDEDDAPPIPQSAAPPTDEPKEITRVMAPVAAARYAKPHRSAPVRPPPPPPTLYERLTEEEWLNEQGVLLQAMRFFTARDFFQKK